MRATEIKGVKTMQHHRHGQSTAEYAIVIAIVLAAVIGMQTFVKRGLQARYKVASDSLVKVQGAGDLVNFTSQEQYEPYYAQTTGMVTVRDDQFKEEYKAGGEVDRTNVAGEFVSKATRKSKGKSFELGSSAAANQEQGW